MKPHELSSEEKAEALKTFIQSFTNGEKVNGEGKFVAALLSEQLLRSEAQGLYHFAVLVTKLYRD